MFSAAIVRRPAIASGSRPWRDWKRRSASASGVSKSSPRVSPPDGSSPGGGEAPAQRRHPRAAIALAQRRPPGDERPPPGGGDRPLGGEGVAQQAVVFARRGQGGDRGGEVAVLEGGLEQEDQVAPPAGDVPLGFDGFRVHPPGRQVRGVEEKGVREQQIEVARIAAGIKARGGGGLAVRRPEPREQGVDRRGVVLGGAQALAIGGSQSGQQNVDLR